jgi:hypothetical protein
MRNSRRFPMFYPPKTRRDSMPWMAMAAITLALSAAPLLSQTNQSDADARLRQLLEQKTRELDTAGKPRPASAAPVTAPVVAPAAAGATNNDAAVRQLLDQKAKDLSAEPQTSEKSRKEQEKARRKAEKEAQQRAIQDAKRRAHEEADRKKENDRVAEENARAAAPAQQEAERVSKEKAIAEQKAREEQERQERINKIKADLAGQTPPPPAASPAPVATPVAPAAPAAPSVPAAPVAPAPAPPPAAVPPGNTDVEAARRLLEQKTRELETATSLAPAAPSRGGARGPSPVVVTSAPAAPSVTTTTGATTDQTGDSARSLLEQKTRELGGTTAPASRTSSSGKPPKGSHAATQLSQPIAAPVESPLPKTKQEKLAELLEKYRSNLITPADYHNLRAKILAEP